MGKKEKKNKHICPKCGGRTIKGLVTTTWVGSDTLVYDLETHRCRICINEKCGEIIGEEDEDERM